MLRIGICDDVAEARQQLHTIIERLLDARAVEHQIYEFSSGTGLTGWLDKHTGELDLVFLDIEMDGINGMEAAKRLRAASTTLQLVFVTGYTDYVFDGYTVGALGYILKPPQQEQISDILTRALTALFQHSEQVFVCQNRDGLYRIPKETIRYFCSDRRQVTCVTDTRRIVFYAKLDEVAQQAGAGFVRIHQRYLVRAAAVDQITSNTVIIGTDRLPVSRAHQPAALAALARAMLE